MDTDDSGIAPLTHKKKASEQSIGVAFDPAAIAKKQMLDLYNSPAWEEVQFACINCGACTFVCPTCWCFDIQDEVCGDKGERLRLWDSCMFPLFTLHGSGHNPRSNKTQRVRQRFMHKLKYYQDKYNSGPACVGCGRCVQACPVNIDIRQVGRQMASKVVRSRPEAASPMEEQKVNNPYLPYPVRIDSAITETEDRNLKTFKLVFLNAQDEKKFAYTPGQFAILSVAGLGEIPIGIATSPTEQGFIKFTVNKVGKVTSHLHNMKAGEIMGVRGPMGNWYPWELLEGKNVVIIGGGFAFTTLRSSIVYMIDPKNRSRFGKIDVVYGARSAGLLLYKDELAEWEKRSDINMHITVDSSSDRELEIQRGLRSGGHQAKGPKRRKRLRDHLRSADHDQVYAASSD